MQAKDIISQLPFRDDYDFFGRKVSLFSDDGDLLSFFRNRCGRFGTKNEGWDDCFFLVKSKSLTGTSFLGTEKDTIPVRSGKVLAGLAAAKILNDTFRKIPDFLFFHGAAVSKDGEGALLLGDSCVGKTTLVLEMLKRGYSFLSDDVCAVQKTSQGKKINSRVFPFPKGLGIRDNTLKLLKIDRTANFRKSYYPDGREKRLIDVCDLVPDCISSDVSVNAVFFLERESSKGGKEGGECDVGFKTFHMVLAKEEKSFFEFLKGLDGVSSVASFKRKDFWKLELTLPSKVLMGKISKFCYENNIMVVDSWVFSDKLPLDKALNLEGFNVAPKICSIPQSEGLINMLQYFWGSMASHYLYREDGGGMMNVIRDLIDLSASVSFYKLSVGKLEETADILCDVSKKIMP